MFTMMIIPVLIGASIWAWAAGITATAAATGGAAYGVKRAMTWRRAKKFREAYESGGIKKLRAVMIETKFAKTDGEAEYRADEFVAEAMRQGHITRGGAVTSSEAA